MATISGPVFWISASSRSLESAVLSCFDWLLLHCSQGGSGVGVEGWGMGVGVEVGAGMGGPGGRAGGVSSVPGCVDGW